MELLILLAQRPRELVTRDEIAARLWGSGPVGDPERSINTAIRKVRLALRDEAGQPRFIETVVGKGYRFVGVIAEHDACEPAAVAPETAEKVRPAAQPPAGSAPRRTSRYRYLPIAAVVLLGTAASALWLHPTTPIMPPMAVRPFTASPGSGRWPAFSPDGARVAYSWADDEHGTRHIYIKSASRGPEIRLTPGAGSNSFPSWSPDGRLIAFLREDSAGSVGLYVIPPEGGEERRVTGLLAHQPSRICWSPDGRSIAVSDSDGPSTSPAIFLVPLDSGRERRLTQPPATGSGDGSPAFSPDGRLLAFLRGSGSLQAVSLYVVPVDGRGEPQGEPRRIITDHLDLTDLAWTADSNSLICSGVAGLLRIPLPGGAAEPIPFENAGDPAVAPKGNRLIYARAESQTAIYRLPGPGQAGGVTKLIASDRFNGTPKVSADGSRIVFMSDRTGTDELWVSDSEGRNPRQITFFGRATLGSPRWSRDGLHIAFDSTAAGAPDVYVIETPAGNAVEPVAPRRITAGAGSNVRPSWSQDGKWIYFGSNRTGKWEIWKCASQGTSAVQVTHGGGREAFEDPEGRYLYFTRPGPEPGIWRIPLAGGGASELVTGRGVQGHWAIGLRGPYYLNDRNEIELLELSTGRRLVVPSQGLRLSAVQGGGMAIAADDRWILITVPIRSESYLDLVENFR